MPTAFLVVSVIGLLFTLNALRPVKFEVFSIFTFFPGWLTSELALHHIAWQAVATAGFVALGALDGWQGWLGLGITVLSWIGLVAIARQSLRAGDVVDAVLGIPTTSALEPRRLVFAAMRRTGVEAVKGIPYVDGGGRRQQLDIYRPADAGEGRPVLLYIHGGGWVIGDKREQGMPMMHYLATRGWVCVTINYRLAPKVLFPEQLSDCNAALRWTFDNIASYGGDPQQIAVSGGSAGGHLCALVALGAGDDVPVRAAVPFYGVYDFTNRFGYHGWGFQNFITKRVMQTSDPAALELASPLSQVHENAPPFFIIHGANDTLVPVKEARAFAAALRSVSHAPVLYAELPGTQHAFEVFGSIRASVVVPRVETFLRSVMVRT